MGPILSSLLFTLLPAALLAGALLYSVYAARELRLWQTGVVVLLLAMMLMHQVYELAGFWSTGVVTHRAFGEPFETLSALLAAVFSYFVLSYVRREDEVNRELRRKNRVLRILGEAGEAKREAEDPEGFLERMCEVVVDEAGYRAACIELSRGGERDALTSLDSCFVKEGEPVEGMEECRVPGEGVEEPVLRELEEEPGQGCPETKDDEAGSVMAVPIESNGERMGILKIFSEEEGDLDETELDLLERVAGRIGMRLRAFEEEQRRREVEERKEFVHSLLRHDVMNKISIAKSYLTMLEEDEEGYVENAAGSLDNGQEIIEKVKTLSKTEEPLRSTRVDLTRSIESALEGNEGELEMAGIELETDLDDGCGDVKGGRLLGEVFQNILENAAEHSGSSLLRVETEREGEECRVTFEDDGEGLGDGEFFGKGAKGAGSRGSGLGLYIAERVVNSYGGRIEAGESGLGGARFDIYLPG